MPSPAQPERIGYERGVVLGVVFEIEVLNRDEAVANMGHGGEACITPILGGIIARLGQVRTSIITPRLT